ncbi:MAG TPA: glucosamine-6-phosphate deaminase [Silvibacterium sp.]|nr:glucosamine-6-phosphate deaminase [Silvibacterium sp.]
MGRKAAADIAAEVRRRLAAQSKVRMIFAAAPSQAEMLASLIEQPKIDWSRMIAFHMDEYLGLPPDAPQRFGLWLRRAIFDRLPFAAVHLIEPGDDPSDSDVAAKQYAAKLAEAPIDIVCLGIGVNGHLAFNDPPADLNDPSAVKIVQLDEICRKQQVDDGGFRRIEDVPLYAITLTVPRLLAAGRLFCCVPGRSKREAVRRTLFDPIGPDCPATALRLHPNCAIYLDRESAPEDMPTQD